MYFGHCENFNPLSVFLSSTPTGVAKREASAYDTAAFNRKQQEQPEPGSGFKLLRLPQQSQATAHSRAHPNPPHTLYSQLRARRSPQAGVGMYNLRGAKQRQAMRATFRSSSPTKRNLWSKEEQEKRDKETAEWEKGPEEDKTVEALTQTGEEKEEDIEMTQEEERAMAVWMEEGRNLLVGDQRQEFTFLGKEGRKGRELVISADTVTCANGTRKR